MQARIRLLETKLLAAEKVKIDVETVKSEIFKLTNDFQDPPDWILKPKKAKASAGVATLFLSDLHWGEVVFPSQVNGVNEYNLEIAEKRLYSTVEHAVDLVKNHVTNAGYPGIIVFLGGDMVSGNIHQELKETNEKPIMPVVLHLAERLTQCLRTLADEFGRVHVLGVYGNHGRNTMKPTAKHSAYESFDWLIYQLLRWKLDDKRFSWNIPDGSDALQEVYGHKYLLTHGDQFRGGDGVIGALGPVTRGDHKKRSRNGQIGLEYDTMCLGHWHQLVQMQRLIINGSLKGYDEYAYKSNFPFEEPRQALWLTHPEMGLTFSMPVYAERKKHKLSQDWIK
jgi:predicted phosphodiesterase